MPNLPLDSAPLLAGDAVSNYNSILQAVNNGISGLVAISTASVGNGADTTDDVLATITLPPNFFTSVGQTLRIIGSGTTASNGNNKTMKIKAGSNTLISSGVVTTNNGSWIIEALFTHTGTNAQSITGRGTSGATAFANNTTLNMTESTSISFTLTGASGTSGVANDVVGNYFIAEIIR